MTANIDEELLKWIDNNIPIDSRELKLKPGAPEHIKLKFNKWVKDRDEYEALFGDDNL